MADLIITQEMQGKTVEVGRDDRIEIRLPESPTTGFAWSIDVVDEQILGLEGSEFSLPATAGIGGGGVRTFAFRTKRAGSARIDLKLWREWEGDASIIERFHVLIVVKS